MLNTVLQGEPTKLQKEFSMLAFEKHVLIATFCS